MPNSKSLPFTVKNLMGLSLQDRLSFIEYWLHNRAQGNVDEGFKQLMLESSPFEGENFAVPGFIYRTKSQS